MDVTLLRAVTDELASVLAEVTRTDLDLPTQHPAWDLGDLYLHLLAQNVALAEIVAGRAVGRRQRAAPLTRSALEASVARRGGGLDVGYRRTARLVEDAFAAVADPTRRCRIDGLDDEIDVATLYGLQVSSTVIHCCDVAQTLGFPYEPTSDVARRAVRIVPSAPSPAAVA